MEITGASVAKTAVNLAKTDNILNKATGFMGMLFPYAGIKQKAVDMYIEDIEKSDLPAETKVFMVLNTKKTFKRIKNQKAIAEIAMNNAVQGTDFTEKSGVNEEWLERFMDSAGFVSSEEIQWIWGKILANEFEKPGSTPPNMIRILSEMTPTYAKAFRKLCSMRFLLISISENEEITGAYWKTGVPYSENEELMNELGISFQVINVLETLGVIKFDSVAGYITTGISDKKVILCVDGKTMEITQHESGSIPIGDVILTSAGEALKNITTIEEISGYDEAIKKYMCSKGVIYSEEEQYQVVVTGDRFQLKRKRYNKRESYLCEF